MTNSSDVASFSAWLMVLGLSIAFGNPSQAGTLIGSTSQSRAFNRNLTAEGTQDWAVWGYSDGGTSISLTPDVRKSGGAGISSLGNISNGNPLRGIGQFGLYGESTFDWTDGNPVASEIGALTGVQHDGQEALFSTIGEGFSLSAIADKAERTLTVYTTVNFASGYLIATLSDGSAVAYESFTGGAESNQSDIFTFRYSADSAGQSLDLTYVVSAQFPTDPANGGNVAIQAASLSISGGTIPEPGSVTLVGLGLAGMAISAIRRRASRNRTEVWWTKPRPR